MITQRIIKWTILLTLTLISTLISAQNLVVNGDLEGTDLNYFRVNDFPDGICRDLQEPRIITDDSLNHFIVVTTNNKYPTTLSSYSHLFITLDKPLNKGTRVFLSMKIKADQDLAIGIGMQSTPDNHIAYDHSISVTTEWKTYTTVLYISNDTVPTIAFDLSIGDGKEINVCFDDFFIQDDISYSDSWRTAKDFLVQKGIQSPDLSGRFSTNTFYAFTDFEKNCFVIVASKQYVQYLDNPILAYGIDEPFKFHYGAGIEILQVILDQYDSQLQYLYDNCKEYSYSFDSIYEPQPEGVAPLLDTIAYDQSEPYNKFFPYDSIDGKEEKCVAGCGPIAMAQVLIYYNYPVTPTGTVSFSTKSGKEYTVNLEQYPVKWDGTEDDIANLVFDCAASTSAKMSPQGTSAQLNNIEYALNNYWNYNGSVINNGHKERLHSIYNELDKKRPIILSGGNHAYICDGYDNDYLHYNFGWGGSYNGYYRMIIIPEVIGQGMAHISGGILIGIAPKCQ